MRVSILLIINLLLFTLSAQDTCYYYVQTCQYNNFLKVESTNCNLDTMYKKSLNINSSAGLYKIKDTISNLSIITRKNDHYESYIYNTIQRNDTFYINGLIRTTQTYANYHVSFLDSFVHGKPAGYLYSYNTIGDTAVILDHISVYSNPGILQSRIFINHESQILKVIIYADGKKGKILPKRKNNSFESLLNNALTLEDYRNYKYGTAVARWK